MSGQDEGVLVGDVLHHPIHIYQPAWSSRFCMNPEQAVISRMRVLTLCAERNSLMFPAHFGASHIGQNPQ
jgi:hypothetical protein